MFRLSEASWRQIENQETSQELCACACFRLLTGRLCFVWGWAGFPQPPSTPHLEPLLVNAISRKYRLSAACVLSVKLIFPKCLCGCYTWEIGMGVGWCRALRFQSVPRGGKLRHSSEMLGGASALSNRRWIGWSGANLPASC